LIIKEAYIIENQDDKEKKNHMVSPPEKKYR
jgi:hypothetical protein